MHRWFKSDLHKQPTKDNRKQKEKSSPNKHSVFVYLLPISENIADRREKTECCMARLVERIFLLFLKLEDRKLQKGGKGLAIFKVTNSGKGTPQKLEDYLKFKLNEDGEKIPRTDAVSAINASADDFSLDCEFIGAKFDTCNTYGSLKYKHYVQGFPPEDCTKMTRERCHELGVEAAKTLWKDFPVLVVTHYDKGEGGEYCWHNHFAVYNCNVKNGRKLNTSGSELWAQKRFIAAQAEREGLTRKGLILENGRIRNSTLEVKTTLAERKLRQRHQSGLNANGGGTFLTQKAELRLAILSAMRATDDYESFCNYLDKEYGIKTKESRGALGFLHPKRRGENRAWIRGKSLGEKYTKEAILNELEKPRDRRGYIRAYSDAGRFEYYKETIRAIFGYNPPDIGGTSTTGERAFARADTDRGFAPGAASSADEHRARASSSDQSGDREHEEARDRADDELRTNKNARESSAEGSQRGNTRSAGKSGIKP